MQEEEGDKRLPMAGNYNQIKTRRVFEKARQEVSVYVKTGVYIEASNV
jgi:hypothetical protein